MKIVFVAGAAGFIAFIGAQASPVWAGVAASSSSLSIAAWMVWRISPAILANSWFRRSFQSRTDSPRRLA